MPGDDAACAIDQNRIRPAVLDDAGRDLGDLRLGMRARIAGVGNQRLNLRYSTLSVFKVDASKTKPADGKPWAGSMVETGWGGNCAVGW